MKNLILALFVLKATVIWAQPNAVKYLSSEHGLSNIQVLDVAHDDQGFVWIATEFGLNRFASNSFKTYYKSERMDGSSLNSNEINKLLYNEGSLYIATKSNGLNVLDLNKNTFTYYTHDPKNLNSIATNDITDIIKGKDGHIWLSTYHQGIQCFIRDKSQFERFNRSTIPNFPSNSVWSMTQDQSGLLYLGHVNNGMTILNPNNNEFDNLTVANTNKILPHDEVKVLFCDSKNKIWIGTRKGLAVYNPTNRSIKKIELAAKAVNKIEPFVYAIREIGHTIWVGTEASQLFMIPRDYAGIDDLTLRKSVARFDLERGNNVSVQNIAPDNYGNVWLATYGAGLGFISHFKPFFHFFPNPNKRLAQFIGSIAVSAIVNDRKNITWLATEGNGIIQIMPDGKITKLSTANSELRDNFLFTAFQDSKDNLWFGQKRGGVSLLDSSRKQWYHIDSHEKITEIRAIIEDTQGNVWLGAREGLFIYDPEKKILDSFRINNSVLGDYVPRALVEDGHGYIWVGTYGQGLYIFNNKRHLIKQIGKDNGLKSNTINHLFRDNKNNIWIATNEGIVFQKADQALGTLKHITPPKRNAWLFIHSITEDRLGGIWCATNVGLLRYLPFEGRFLAYDQDFGIPMGGFNNNSVGMDKKGRLFFGTPTSVCFFDPSDIPLKLPASPIHFSRFTVYKANKSNDQYEEQVCHMKPLQLKHNENTFQIAFSLMDYAMQGLMEYSYQLYGLDDAWTFIGNEQALNFRNVPYGSYKLRIRARPKGESWLTDFISLPIEIAPPFYLSRYAIVLYVLMTGAVLYVIVFFYIKKLKAEGELRLKKLEQQQYEQLYTERLNFYTNITHELRTPLTLILGPLDDLLNENKLALKQRGLIQVVQRNANRLFNLVNQLLEFRKVESQHKPLVLGEGYLGNMIQEIVEKYIESNTKIGLAILYEGPTSDFKTCFDAEIIHIVLDNLLSNAYKYTTKGHITVSLKYEQEQLKTWAVICVKDTGLGIAPEYIEKIFNRFFQIPGSDINGTGIGLALVKELAAIHHGKIEVRSQSKIGSEFCFRIPTDIIPEASARLNASKETSMVESIEVNPQSPLILLVEDDDDLRQYLVSVLQSRYIILDASRGKKGLEIALQHTPDLIISDIMMPDMDGFEMVKRLKAVRETSHIPIVLLTAKDADADRQTGYANGVDSYLIKPIKSHLLYERIDNILAKKKAIQEYVMQNLALQDKQGETSEPNTKLLWKENEFVQDFIRIVESRIQDEVLDVLTLAERMNMSQSTLYRKLKSLTGKNINQFIRKIRMWKAAELLRSGKYNVTEVSFMVGINSVIYFRQCFKEEFGKLPSEYQKQIK